MRIATYNVRNLLAEPGTAAPKSPKELKALAGSIDALGADVLLLQEVGSAAALGAVNDGLRSPYPFLDVSYGNSDRGIHLAIMSREPYRLESHREQLLTDESGVVLREFATEDDARAGRTSPLKIQRDLMLAEIDIASFQPLAIFNVHLKSKTNRSWRRLAADEIRAAEARTIARIIGNYLLDHPERPIFLLGDFNDTRRSERLAPLFDLPLADPVGETTARTRRNPSTYWPKRRMRIDFVLASPAALALLVPDSARIHSGHRERRASDHYPVSIDLDDDALGSLAAHCASG